MVTASEMGTDARICREAETLARAGYEVRVLCLKGDVPASAKGVELIEQDFRRVPRRARLAAIAVRMSVSALLRRADIYHAHNIPALPSSWLSARIRRARLVYDAHELYAARVRSAQDEVAPPPGWRLRAEAALERSLASRADLHLTVSPRYADEIAASLRLPRPIPIPNYPPLAPPGVDPILRKTVGVNDDEIVILYQGGYYLATRALDVLIRAMKVLPPQYHLAFVGFGPHGEERQLEDWIREANVGSRVSLLPAVPHQELARWTSGADIGVIPFRMERQAMVLGSPNKLYEYLSSSVAVLSSPGVELAEVLAETRAGATYDPASVEDFVEKVRALGATRSALKDIGRLGRAAAEQKYSWEAVERTLTNAYESLGRSESR